MGSAPKPPPPPDPYKVSQAETEANIEAMIVSMYTQNANQLDADGNQVIYTYEDTKQVSTLGRDADGNLNGQDIAHTIPIPKRTVILSPVNQLTNDKEQEVKLKFSSIALKQADNWDTLLDVSLSRAGLPARGAIPAAPDINANAPRPGEYIRTVGGDYIQVRDATTNALFARLNRDTASQREDIETMLAQKGLVAGTKAHDRAWRVLITQPENDARSQIYLAAGQEQDRQFAQEMAKAQFGNAVTDTVYRNDLTLVQFENAANISKYEALAQIWEFANLQREKEWTEIRDERSVVINETIGLMKGGHVQPPTFQPYRGGGMQPAQVGNNVYRSAQIEQDNYWKSYQAKQQKTAGLIGFGGSLLSMGMGGMGGGGMFGGMFGGR